MHHNAIYKDISVDRDSNGNDVKNLITNFRNSRMSEV